MLFGLKQATFEKIKSVFAAYPEIEEVIIYGSRARGDYQKGSDIDLTLKGQGLTDKIRSRVYWQIDELNTPYFIDLSVFDRLSDEKLKRNIENEGKIFYKKERKL